MGESICRILDLKGMVGPIDAMRLSGVVLLLAVVRAAPALDAVVAARPELYATPELSSAVQAIASTRRRLGLPSDSGLGLSFDSERRLTSCEHQCMDEFLVLAQLAAICDPPDEDSADDNSADGGDDNVDYCAMLPLLAMMGADYSSVEGCYSIFVTSQNKTFSKNSACLEYPYVYIDVMGCFFSFVPASRAVPVGCPPSW